MDPVSALASAIAIAGLAEKVVKKSAQVVDGFRKAPSQLGLLRRNASLLHHLVQQIAIRRLKLSPVCELQDSLYDCLLEAEAAITELLQQSHEYVDSSYGQGKRSRMKWAFIGSSEMASCDLRIKSILDVLSGIYLSMLLDGQDSILTKQETIISRQEDTAANKLFCSFSTCTPPLCDHGLIKRHHQMPDSTSFEIWRLNDGQDSVANLKGVSKADPNPITIPSGLSWNAKSTSWLQYFGFSASLQRREGHNAKYFSVSAKYLPSFFFRQSKSFLVLEISFQILSNPWKLSVRHLHMSTLNTVSDSSDVIVACRNGSTGLVRELFKAKKASIYDVTTENLSLLYLAIQARNISLVRLLLDEGADVNQTFGRNFTSPLQWALYLGEYDIARLILGKTPDGTHISAWKRWNCLAYLFEGVHKFHLSNSHNLLDFLSLLNHDQVYIDTETKDERGINALQLAASWYSGEVLAGLFSLGASIEAFSLSPWSHPGNPIIYSIISGNLSSFQALLPFYKDIDALDNQGFSMLSYTARNGNVKMTELLLQSGADEILPDYDIHSGRESNTCGEKSDKDPGLDVGKMGTSSTNSEKASDKRGSLLPWTLENYDKYIRCLERHGRVVIHVDNESEGGREIFWDAVAS